MKQYHFAIKIKCSKRLSKVSVLSANEDEALKILLSKMHENELECITLTKIEVRNGFPIEIAYAPFPELFKEFPEYDEPAQPKIVYGAADLYCCMLMNLPYDEEW